MKILLFADNHFCEKYSIIQKYGDKYSIRIENQLKSINWLEQLAIDKQCDVIVCLGDFFDKPELTDQEITATKDIKWNNLKHYFIIGNHESSASNLQFNSTKTLESDTRQVIADPLKITVGPTELCFLPYVVESDRKPLAEYFGPIAADHRVIFSHNDLKGIQLGMIESKTGVELDDIDNNCDLFLNGHLHNGTKVSRKCINLGNLTGKDFGENAEKYAHGVMLLDTDTLAYSYEENPYAFNFYKFEITKEADFEKLKHLKTNAILSIKCNADLIEALKELLESLSDTILEHRIIAVRDVVMADTEHDIADLTVDHLAKFVECCYANLENTKILQDELSEICK